MSLKARVLVIADIAALIALFVVWFRVTHEKVLVKERVGASGEARLQSFLAAERFVARMGLGARALRDASDLDALPAGGVLLMPARRQLDRRRMDALLAWVERGGHLIVEAELQRNADPLLDLVGVKRSTAEFLPKPAAVEVPGASRALTITYLDTMQLDAEGGREPRLRLGPPGAARLLVLERGKGLVTATTQLHFARNHDIGNHDHAELLWRLASLTPARELRVFYPPRRASLWDFLVENAAPALAAGGALLALWLWSIAPRFGPVAPDVPPGRRRLLDHLRASGRYYWAKGLRARLVVAARDAALRRMTRAQPDFAVAPQAERAERLSLLIGASKEEAARFMAAGSAMRGADFIRLAQHAQRVHSALEKGNKQ